MIDENQLKITIIGAGTAGFVSALMLNEAFKGFDITVISSSKIGIVGVGEGSTEHWKRFMEMCQIPLEELLVETDATHKYGIRFEGWSDAHPDYFHSVAGDDSIFAFGLFPTYMGFIRNNMLLTNNTTTIGLVKNKIRREKLHENTNQYHFDTNKLNNYFTKLCFKRSIRLIDGDVKSINKDPENGTISSVLLEDGSVHESDFWIDASGFNRVLSTELGNTEWNSFKDYLLADSAIAFPTEADPSGQIRPYTRARAASAGWVWEIPTQARRGNGYVFSSNHITETEVIDEVSKMTGYNVTPAKTFKFDPGHLKNAWVKNCCAVGLSYSFVEPIEATSIGSTIQQMMHLIPCLASYKKENQYMQVDYNRKMSRMMDNILTMVRLHYYTDKTNTKFWVDAKNMKINDELQHLLNLWSERMPSRYDIENNNGEMFVGQHLIHVAQGQNVLSLESAHLAIERLGLQLAVMKDMSDKRLQRTNHELVDHAEALREINVW